MPRASVHADHLIRPGLAKKGPLPHTPTKKISKKDKSVRSIPNHIHIYPQAHY